MEKESKQLGLFDIFCLGLGGAIGSGIFVMMGSGIAATGRSIFISVAFGCLFMLMAYFFHVVMSSMFVLEGGDYDMKAMLFNPTLTGVSAVFTMMGGIGFAMYGGAIADYASMVFPVIGEYQAGRCRHHHPVLCRHHQGFQLRFQDQQCDDSRSDRLHCPVCYHGPAQGSARLL